MHPVSCMQQVGTDGQMQQERKVLHSLTDIGQFRPLASAQEKLASNFGQGIDVSAMQDLRSVACNKGVTTVTGRRSLLGAPRALCRRPTEARCRGTTRKAAM
ncbi:hypothetical protein GCM10027601_20510 [Nocardioides ungokensis]